MIIIIIKSGYITKELFLLTNTPGRVAFIWKLVYLAMKLKFEVNRKLKIFS